MYSIGQLSLLLPGKIHSDKEYVVDTHRGAKVRVAAGTHIQVGEVDDSTQNESGTMVVLEVK